MRRLIRVGCLSCPDGMVPSELWGAKVSRWALDEELDLLVTSELPFGDWIAAGNKFDAQLAIGLALQHRIGAAWLGRLSVRAVITSLAFHGTSRLQNRAAVVEHNTIRLMHAKRHFPQEDGWFERSWFEASGDSPAPLDVDGMKVSALLCTEAMFPEDARQLGQEGVDLIAVPRATGAAVMWDRALGMAAISAGSFVVSANRAEGLFAGGSAAFGPDGESIRPLDRNGPFSLFELDLSVLPAARLQYPRYVFAGCSARQGAVAA